jgi:prolyl oligopeptidase
VLGAVAAGAQVHGRDGISLPDPPVVKTGPVVDEYKSTAPGVPTKITDLYRWLEDAHSPETRAYIAAQNAYTAQYFSQVKIRVVDALGVIVVVLQNPIVSILHRSRRSTDGKGRSWPS